MCRKLKEVCDFINVYESSHDIMDCYEEYLDQQMDRDTLITICQRVLDDGREDFVNNSQQVHNEFLKHAKWLGI